MFSGLRIGVRLRILVVIQCLLMIAVALTGLSGMSATKGRLHEVYDDSIVPLLHLDNMLSQNFQARSQLDEAFAASSVAEAARHLDRITGFRTEADKAWKEYAASSMSAEERKLADEAAQAHVALVTAAEQTASAFKAQGRAAAAEVDGRVERIAKFDRWRAAVDKLIEHQARDSEAGYKAADGDYAQAKWVVVAALLFGVGFAAIVSWLVIRSITQPLAVATGIAGRIAGGDLTKAIAVRGNDETASLMSAFARMQTSLREMVVQINGGVTQLSSAAVELATSAEHVSSSSEQQSEAAAAVASSVEEVTVSIAQLSARAHETEAISAEASRSSQSGAEVVNQSAVEITSIAQSVDRAASVVKALGEQSRQIATIVNVIKDIADQTNLLALNAAIEAARAGEQGRGFAVVADEVRKLSEKTAGSTQEIASMIDAILRGTQDAVRSMEEGVTRVQTGVDLAKQAGSSMNDLQHNSTRMLQAVHDMSSSLKEQRVAADEIARQVERIAHMSEQNGVAIKQSARASRDLETLSGHLRQAVGGFKV